jgi:ketosteroid isomerase-like protein
MREETTDVIRVPVEPTSHPRRRLEERIGLRFPRLIDRLGRLLWTLPPRMRRPVERRFLRMAWDAFNRDDLEACFMLYHPDCECVWDRRWPSIGIPAGMRGKTERIRTQQRINSEWQQLRFTPEQVIHFDDRLVSVGRMRGIGLASGIEVDTEWVADFTVRDARVVQERITVDRAEGLAAAGLS